MNEAADRRSSAVRLRRSYAPTGLVLLGLAAAAALWTMDGPRAPGAWVVPLVRSFALAWGCYLAAAVVVSRARGLPGWTLRWIVGVAVALHLVVMVHHVPMSTDASRYRWDGRVLNHGINPYRYAPDAPQLARLRDADWRRIWYKQVRTVYPPLAEVLFAALARVPASDTWPFRVAFGVCDTGTTLLLIPLLRRTGRRAEQVIWFAWNPLPILETASGAHVDGVGACLLVLALLLVARRPDRPTTGSALAYAASVLVKGPTLLALPFSARRGGWRWAAVFVVAAALVTAPFLTAGRYAISGLGFYFSHWETNASAAYLLRSGMDVVLGHRVGFRRPEVIARELVIVRAIAGAALLWLMVWYLRRHRPGTHWLLSATFGLLAASLLVGSPVFPWYAIVTIPLLCWWPLAGWVVFSLVVFVLYYVRLVLPHAYPFPLLLGYVPVYALLIGEWIWRRSRPPAKEAEGGGKDHDGGQE